MMNKGVQLIFILVASLLSSFSVMAQTLQASVNKTQVAKNEVINLRIMADTELSSDAIDFNVLENDFFLGQPRYGRSSNNINGRKSVRTEWSISIAPMKEGVLTIPSFSADGMRTEPIKLRVTASQAEPNLDDLFSFNISVDNSTLYPQQSATLRMQLLIKADTRRLDNPQIVPPQIEGMKLEAIGGLQQGQKILNGLEVAVIEQSFRLTANQPGTYTLIGPRLTGSYIYGDSLTGSTKIMPINTKAEQMPIEVKPIPSEFEGEWLPASALEMTQSWQDDQGNTLSVNALNTVKQGSSLTRTIQIKARGTQAEYLPRVSIDYPSSLRVYPEQPQFDSARDGTVIMTVKQVIIPTEAGSYTLPGYHLNWWDSQNDEAKKATLPELQLEIEQSDTGLITLPESPLPTPPESAISPEPNGGVSSLWQTLTFVFAGLWVATLGIAIWAWKKRPMTASKTVSNTEQPLCVDALKKVINEGDAAKIERSVNEYLNTHRDRLSSGDVQAVKQELDAMNQARFSANQQPWHPDSLLAKIQNLSKANVTKTDHQLEKL
ncbi:BatD family protein [Vibrio diabolicus]|uniref:BatD family protein n=1 Tax=Vibrio diabolicus TaxID=50719 RepID=UPI0021513927|nr:BatD family protein [Vibrio diabolicus]MCE9831080.1 BatD family protein [Vibrio diabolicus]MCR9564378.1 BatD family protein [Vibrio alginolyticus]MCS0336472.1 BatD family protein [Vibrio diabolicus]